MLNVLFHLLYPLVNVAYIKRHLFPRLLFTGCRKLFPYTRLETLGIKNFPVGIIQYTEPHRQQMLNMLQPLFVLTNSLPCGVVRGYHVPFL